MLLRIIERSRSTRAATRLAVLAIAVACAAGPASAYRAGLKGGYIASRFIWAGDYWPGLEQGRHDGYGVTAFGEWFDYRGASMRVGLAYNQRGGTLEWTNPETEYPPGKVTDDLRLDYLTASVALKIRREARHVFPYAFIGPHVDFSLDREHTCESDSGARPCRNSYLDFWSESREPIVYGFSAGIGVEIPSPDQASILLELSYERSLSRTIVCEPASCGEDLKGGYEAYCIFVGFAF